MFWFGLTAGLAAGALLMACFHNLVDDGWGEVERLREVAQFCPFCSQIGSPRASLPTVAELHADKESLS